MNRIGVALASDSAVTLVGDATPKIYNSADKLFLLSERSPLGIMVYGGAELQHVPWETLVKVYRAQDARAKALPSVEAYAQDFLRFLQQNLSYFPPPTQDKAVRDHVGGAFRELSRLIAERVDIEIKRRGHIPQKEMRSLLPGWALDALETLRRRFVARPRLQPPIRSATLARRYGTMIRRMFSQLLAGFPTTPEIIAKASRLVIEVLGRAVFTDDASGIVIAGFGRDDIMPSMVHLRAEDVVANRVRCLWREHETIGHENAAFVMSFAQKEMVHLFMEGIDPVLDQLVSSLVGRVYRSLPAEFVKRAGIKSSGKLERELDALASDVLPRMWDEIRQFRREHFSSPVMEIVSHLPKDELAAMAEALVNLTSFRRRVSKDAATVGGPVDVAVITKGDGFVWIRRKHYFDPALNPRYIARHYQ